MNDNNRNLLMTYTVFHIGVYLSLATAIIAAQALAGSILGEGVMKFSLVMFFFAGLCGAIVASNLHEFDDWTAYKDAPIGPFGMPMFRYRVWERAEHLFFWVGVTALVWKALIT